jgi:outer membrane lipoprotein-sorting protein
MTRRDADGGAVRPVALVLALVAVAGVAVGGVALAEDRPSGDTVLERAGERYANAETYTGTATVTVSNDTASANATVEYAAAEPNGSRVRVTRGNATLVAGTNGTVAWVVHPSGLVRAWPANETDERARAWAENETDVSEANLTAWREAAAADGVHHWSLENNTTATVTGTETVGGDETYVVEVEPLDGNVSADATLWVATDDYRVLRWVTTDGTNRTTVDVATQRFNASVHESTFQPPADRVTGLAATTYDSLEAAAAAVDHALPRLTAPGYRFARADVLDYRGESVVASTYAADGDAANATLLSTTADDLPYDAGDADDARNVTVDGRDAVAGTVRDRSVVAWSDGDVTYALVTGASVDEAVALAEDVSVGAANAEDGASNDSNDESERDSNDESESDDSNDESEA